MNDLRAVKRDNVETEGTVGGTNAANGERLRQTVSGDTVCSARQMPHQPAPPVTVGNGGGSGGSMRSAVLASVVGIRRATCPRCGDGFDCGVAATACWCQKFPALDLTHRPIELIGEGCLCSTCLSQALARQAQQPTAPTPATAAVND